MSIGIRFVVLITLLVLQEFITINAMKPEGLRCVGSRLPSALKASRGLGEKKLVSFDTESVAHRLHQQIITFNAGTPEPGSTTHAVLKKVQEAVSLDDQLFLEVLTYANYHRFSVEQVGEFAFEVKAKGFEEAVQDWVVAHLLPVDVETPAIWDTVRVIEMQAPLSDLKSQAPSLGLVDRFHNHPLRYLMIAGGVIIGGALAVFLAYRFCRPTSDVPEKEKIPSKRPK
jgi:hypothetical protein